MDENLRHIGYSVDSADNVLEELKQKGYADVMQQVIIKLKQWCYENGLTPICGCWYYNHNSKKTLESAGMVTKTRLLNIEFVQK